MLQPRLLLSVDAVSGITARRRLKEWLSPTGKAGVPGGERDTADGDQQCTQQSRSPDCMPQRRGATAQHARNKSRQGKDNCRLDHDGDHREPAFLFFWINLESRSSSSSDNFTPPPPSSVAIIFSADPSKKVSIM